MFAFEVAQPVAADRRDELLADCPGEPVDRVLAFDLSAIQPMRKPLSEHVGDGFGGGAGRCAFFDLV